jgi:hypothetical protein
MRLQSIALLLVGLLALPAQGQSLSAFYKQLQVKPVPVEVAIIRPALDPPPVPVPTPAPTPDPVDPLVSLLSQMVSAGHDLDLTTSAEAAATLARQKAQAKADAARTAFWDELHRRYPDPTPQPPGPTPQPPTPVPSPTGPIRVLFTYDPMKMGAVTPAQQSILTAPAIRAYLDAHCPKESGCLNGQCPLTAVPAPCYLFLTAGADLRQLTPVWQSVWSGLGNTAPFKLYVWNSAGQPVASQDWPASVDDTLTLLKKFGGQ